MRLKVNDFDSPYYFVYDIDNDCVIDTATSADDETGEYSYLITDIDNNNNPIEEKATANIKLIDIRLEKNRELCERFDKDWYLKGDESMNAETLEKAFNLSKEIKDVKTSLHSCITAISRLDKIKCGDDLEIGTLIDTEVCGFTLQITPELAREMLCSQKEKLESKKNELEKEFEEL